MYEDEWNRFMQTGQINDYLAYRMHDMHRGHMENAADGAGKIQERKHAGFRGSYGDYNKVGANRRV